MTSQANVDWIAQMTADNGYLHGLPIGNDEWACIMPLMFTGAIIRGTIGSDIGYENRWCYKSVDVAIAALEEWKLREFEDEPIGWHRHPDTGRRREDGNPATEYINR